jgi:hypothetical protein
MKLTLDWNCVIDVEEERRQAPCVRELIQRHREGELEVALLAASASENTRSKRFPGNAAIFCERISAVGWLDLPLVPMPAVIGLSYLDFCFIVGDGEQFKLDMDALWQAIAPKVPKDPSDHLPSGIKLSDESIQSEHLSKWRNTWCDVVSAYSHVHQRRDIFVTNNTRDFQDNKEKLSALGMRHIATPSEALVAVDKIRQADK